MPNYRITRDEMVRHGVTITKEPTAKELAELAKPKIRESKSPIMRALLNMQQGGQREFRKTKPMTVRVSITRINEKYPHIKYATRLIPGKLVVFRLDDIMEYRA